MPVQQTPVSHNISAANANTLIRVFIQKKGTQKLLLLLSSYFYGTPTQSYDYFLIALTSYCN